MLFNSIDFLLFLLITFLIYWIAISKTVKGQNIFISLISLFFYAWWDWRFVGLILVTILSTYFSGMLIAKAKKQETIVLKKKKSWWVFICTLLLNIGILFCFKYFNFFIQSFADAFLLFGKDLNITLFRIILPVGISFYTFTALSYTIDVYRGRTSPTNDFFAYVAYVSFFPALFCGPVGRSTSQLLQFFSKRKFNLSFITEGGKLMLWGFFMKLCVANRIGSYVDAIYNNVEQHNGSSMILATVLYAFQLYCDFGGYTLIAIGVGTLFGIKLQENFRRPYLSTSFSEYWKRNHISLTQWLMDYVYYPLVGDSSKLIYWNFCMIVTFLISGIWHGVGWTFILWGLYQGIFIVLSTNSAKKRKRFEKKRNLQKNSFYRAITIVGTFLFICCGLIFFRANNVSDAFHIIKNIFTSVNSPLFVTLTTFSYIVIGMVILLFKDIKDEFFPNKFRIFGSPYTAVRLSGYAFLIILILLIGVFDNTQFIYFQF